MRAVDPRVVIYPVGYLNRFRRPHLDVQERYLRNGSHIYRTDRDGALTVNFANGKIRVTPHRATYRRYWQTPLIDDPVPDVDGYYNINNNNKLQCNLVHADVCNHILITIQIVNEKPISWSKWPIC